jgi:hypothetical protein
MRSTISRKFTLVDAMVLVAAVGIAFVLIRDYLNDDYVRGVVFSLPDVWALSKLWRTGTLWSGVLAPLAVALSLSLWILRWRQPRPDLRRLFKQPGMIASSATVFATSIFLLKVLFREYYLDVSGSFIFDLHRVWIWRLPWNGEIVAVAWILLWLGGNWRSEPSWIDRAGRVLGGYWVVSGVFFDFLLRY